MRPSIFLFSIAVIGLFSGCGKSEQAVAYDVPKADAPAPAAAPMASTPMAARTLPESSLNRAHEPQWTVPATWTKSEGSAMRRGSFAVAAPEGAIDIAITSFPGDVGGPLANVNRWRGQIGLAPVAPDQLDSVYVNITGSHMPATLAEMSNGANATLAATIVEAGNSWFIKMSGPTDAVKREKDNFLDFVRSIDLHHH